jgi:hypothetical protein
VGLNSLKSPNLTNTYPNNNNNNNNNKVKSKPLELYELAGKILKSIYCLRGARREMPLLEIGFKFSRASVNQLHLLFACSTCNCQVPFPEYFKTV